MVIKRKTTNHIVQNKNTANTIKAENANVGQEEESWSNNIGGGTDKRIGEIHLVGQ